MNILYINHYAGSIHHGMEFRPYYLAKEWTAQGHSVTIVAADFSHLRSKNPTIRHSFETENIDGINYCWLKSIVYQGNSTKRALSMLDFVLKLRINAKKLVKMFNPNVLITSSTYPIDTFAGQKIAKLSKAKLIHEVHDMWPATLTEIGGMSAKHPFVKMMAIGEKSFVKHSDEIVSMLPNTTEHFVALGGKMDHIHYISNGIVMEDWVAPEEIPEQHHSALDELHKQNKFIIGYFGGHALSNSLGLLIDAAALTKNSNVHFVLVGDGVEKKRLIEKAHNLNLRNITFLPAVPKKSIPKLLKQFSVVIITGLDSPLYRFGSSLNKMFDAMMAEKPVIMAMDVAKNPIETYNCGIVVKDYNPNTIVNAINKYYALGKNELDKIGSTGRAGVIKDFNYTTLSNRFSRLFN